MFDMSQMNPKMISYKLQSQFNHHTLPVTPFNPIPAKSEYATVKCASSIHLVMRLVNMQTKGTTSQ